MDTSRAALIAAADDRVRIYTAEEEERLASNLRAITREVHQGLHRQRRHDLDFLCALHRRLFDGVRGHAGRYRRHDYGSERLVFGPNRSLPRDEVEAALQEVFRKFHRSFASFIDNPEAPDYEESAIHMAVWVHAEIIRIHPFEDGNGRSSRLFKNAVLVALGLQPVPIEACKQEYYDCLNRYIGEQDIAMLRDLYIRLYPLA